MNYKNVLQKLHNSIIKFFVWMLPVGLIMIIGSLGPSIDTKKLSETPLLVLVFGAAFIAWILASFYFLVSLIVSKTLREGMLAKIAGVQEADEREEYIVGRAAKSSFLLTMAALIALFAISTWRYGESIEHPADFQSITVGHFHIKTNSEEPNERKTDERGIQHTVKYHDFPLSKSSIILLILFLQGFSYRLFARRYSKSV